MSKLCLKSVSVRGQVTGKFATFAVEQTYENQSDTVLEVTYCFPLSRTATVTGFRALVGEKVIHGAVKEKSEARKEYQQALVRGNSAYMATNEESNIFKMAIGKIAIGETVRVTLDYVDVLDVLDMKMRVVVPTLVAPRYASATTETLKYNSEEVEYRATIEIAFNPALGITDFDSPSHTIKICENTVVASNIKLNRDFVLEAALKEKSATAAWQYPLRNGNRLLYLSFLPLLAQNEERQPRDFVFVIDISGSMAGEKLRQTKAAVQKCLQSLSSKDRFNIITFNSHYSLYNNDLIEMTNENLFDAMAFVAGLEALGGTEMGAPILKAIENFGDGKIIFFFTDGQIGYEELIADNVRQNISRNSLFIFGIDTSVNMNGLEKIAKAGHGKAEFIVNEDQIRRVVAAQFARATKNKLWEVEINRKSNRILEKIERQSVIFDNEPYDVLLEVEKEVRDDVELVCRCGSEKHVFEIRKDEIQMSDLPLDKIYYAEKIRKIEQYFSHEYRADSSGYEKEIVAIAVENQIDSKYTAFIAVNERDEKITDVPVYQDTELEKPAGWAEKRSGGFWPKLQVMFLNNPSNVAESSRVRSKKEIRSQLQVEFNESQSLRCTKRIREEKQVQLNESEIIREFERFIRSHNLFRKEENHEAFKKIEIIMNLIQKHPRLLQLFINTLQKFRKKHPEKYKAIRDALSADIRRQVEIIARLQH